MKLTAQIKRGLKEFTEEQCLEAVKLSNEGYGGNGISWEVLGNHNYIQASYVGDRLVATGKYILEQKRIKN